MVGGTANARSKCQIMLQTVCQGMGGQVWIATGSSYNGNTFIANLWKDTQDTLGIKVHFTPPYHSSSLGGVERKHWDLKLGLKAALHDTSSTHRYGQRGIGSMDV